MPAHEPNPLREARVGFYMLSIVLSVAAVLLFLRFQRAVDKLTQQ